MTDPSDQTRGRSVAPPGYVAPAPPSAVPPAAVGRAPGPLAAVAWSEPVAEPFAPPPARAGRAAGATPTAEELALLEEIATMARSRARAGGRGSGHKTVVMLSLAVPGLGHHRLDELERGLVFLAAAFVAFGASALAPATFAVTLFVSGAAVYDAHRGARSADAGGAPRPATAGLLLLPAAATLALLVALAP